MLDATGPLPLSSRRCLFGWVCVVNGKSCRDTKLGEILPELDFGRIDAVWFGHEVVHLEIELRAGFVSVHYECCLPKTGRC